MSRVDYQALVQSRKSCRTCSDLTNLADYAGGAFDSDHIGHWTRWQSNLNAKLMIVGQDWGDTAYLVKTAGLESPSNPTNSNLVKLLASIGVGIDPLPKLSAFDGQVFLTNAILCLKEGGMQAAVKQEWFKNCGNKHLKPTIELVKPKVLISLGEKVYDTLRDLYDFPRMRFRDAVARESGIVFTNGIHYFPMYHCGSRIMNTHRKLEQQVTDWARVKAALDS